MLRLDFVHLRTCRAADLMNVRVQEIVWSTVVIEEVSFFVYAVAVA